METTYASLQKKASRAGLEMRACKHACICLSLIRRGTPVRQEEMEFCSELIKDETTCRCIRLPFEWET